MPFGGSFGFSGLQYQPWSPSPSLDDAGKDFFNVDFGNALDAFRAPYVQQSPWSNFAAWLQGTGARQMENLFKMENARRISDGGDLSTQLTPMDFLQSFNPVSLFRSMSPRDRGEADPGAMTPFTVFRTR